MGGEFSTRVMSLFLTQILTALMSIFFPISVWTLCGTSAPMIPSTLLSRDLISEFLTRILIRN